MFGKWFKVARAFLAVVMLLSGAACSSVPSEANNGHDVAGKDAAVDSSVSDSQADTVGLELLEDWGTGREGINWDLPATEGGFGWPCDDNEDCNSSFCVETADGNQCTIACVTECPGGWSCVQNQAALPDIIYICVPGFTRLCAPCRSHGECNPSGYDLGDKCVDMGYLGGFCGVQCTSAEHCPEGYGCVQSDLYGGGTSFQCVKIGGECQCSGLAVNLGAWTTCTNETEYGACDGEVHCLAEGPAECIADEASIEECDALDNNCDGVVDEGFGTTVCGLGVCEHEIANCSGGIEKECDPMEGAGVELCNSYDDDCDGETDEGYPDTDGDGVLDCLTIDNDGDGVLNWQDNCQDVPNPDQANNDYDMMGDVCDDDDDNDQTADVDDCAPFDQVVYAGAPELCDGKDNNCNNDLDEGLGSTTCGLGKCQHTIANCVNGEVQQCDAFLGAGEEVCDGEDNDCDGQVDDGFGSVTCGIGQCLHSVVSCNNGVAQECDPFQGITPEVCDGKDNDCDGNADEDMGTITCGMGECLQTLQICKDGQFQFCNPFAGAQPEVCDSDDNDCDGQVDEDLGYSACGVGACAHSQSNCANGLPNPCNPLEGMGDESCNGIDDDCNGKIDDDLGFDICGKGICAHSVPLCINGVVQVCNPFNGASAEVCDNLDNDCDGEVDEDMGSTTCGFGACEHTLNNCEAGQFQVCNPFDGALPEVCDGVDNDCDLQVDEGMGTVSCGKGMCFHTIFACTDGQEQLCDPMAGAEPESCDGADNDCDGMVDENLGALSCGLGICKHTVPNCQWGLPNECDPFEGAVDEQCNALDDNCDGTADEGFPDTNADGVADCVSTDVDGDGIVNWQDNCPGVINPDQKDFDHDLAGDACDPDDDNDLSLDEDDCEPYNPKIHPAQDESCNGVDDDCDIDVDEDLGTSSCGIGDCVNTVLNCLAGEPVVCDPFQGAGPEQCDGQDNNCNGLVDEGLDTTSCGFGLCNHTILNCLDGNLQECNPFDGLQPEVCDGVDNDCDNKVDEELGTTTCGLGECHNTIDNCANGVIKVCNPFAGGSKSEVCDGKDNDCDGPIDEDLGTTTCGLGECEHTVDNCIGAQVQVCDPLAGKKVETCDGLDNDCDGDEDEDLGSTTCGLGICEHTVDNCVKGEVQDCDPLEGTMTEICDELDNNCNGEEDEGENNLGCEPWYIDDDDDGYGVGVPKCLCGESDEYDASAAGDCEDTNPELNPGKNEICDNNVDDDCDDLIDKADPECALESCLAWLADDPTLESGIYTIDPDAAGGEDPFEVYCDMVNDGGGWTLAMKLSSGQVFAYHANYWTNTSLLNSSDLTLATNNAKYESYVHTKGNAVRMCKMSAPTDCISGFLSQEATLLEVFEGNADIEDLAPATWKSWDSVPWDVCNAEKRGRNLYTEGGKHYTYVRWGYVVVSNYDYPLDTCKGGTAIGIGCNWHNKIDVTSSSYNADPNVYLWIR
jgi:hypothetical protein